MNGRKNHVKPGVGGRVVAERLKRECLRLTKIDFEIFFALLHISRFSFLYRAQEGALIKRFRFCSCGKGESICGSDNGSA